MPCDRKLRKGETISQRAEAIRKAVESLAAGLGASRIKAIIGPQGAIAFLGWSEEDRNGVDDNCAYRRIMATGSALAKAAIMRAEQLAGRSVNKQALAQGVHSHDRGATWHHGH
jgi:hypothetical protein